MAQKTPVWQFRAFQNWVKTILISELVEENDTAAEFCCGSGLDTGKWDRSKIKRYYGFDLLKSNLDEAKSKWTQKGSPYEADFIEMDLNRELIDSYLPVVVQQQPPILFDVVSCFDGMQSSFSDPIQAEQFIKNAASKLKVGGFFFGLIPDSSAIWYKAQRESHNGLPYIKSSLFNIYFDTEIQSFFGCKYNLVINNDSTVTENLIHFPSFLNICKKYNLTLVEATNLTDFYEENRKNYDSKLKTIGVISEKAKKIEQPQLDLISLYTTFIFIKELPEPKMIKTLSQ